MNKKRNIYLTEKNNTYKVVKLQNMIEPKIGTVLTKKQVEDLLCNTRIDNVNISEE